MIAASIEDVFELMEPEDLNYIKEMISEEEVVYDIPDDLNNLRYKMALDSLFENLKHIPVELLEAFIDKHKMV